MPRFAANLGMLFADRPLLERIGAAAAAGFKAVELQIPYATPAAQVRAEVERHGLTMLGLNTPMGREGEFGLAAVPGREQDFAAAFQQALDYIVAIKGNAIHCMAGGVAPEQRAVAEKTFIANLSRAADLAAAQNITLLLEPINPRDRPTYFLTTPEQAAKLVDEIGKPNVKLQFDFYHTQISGGDLLKRFEKHLPWIGHLQIAAVPSRAEPDEGEINYPAVFETVDKLGYRGWVSAEYKPRGKTEDGLGWMRVASQRN